MIDYIYLFHKTFNSRPKGPDDPDGEVLLSVTNQNLPEYPKLIDFALIKGVTDFMASLGSSGEHPVTISRHNTQK